MYDDLTHSLKIGSSMVAIDPSLKTRLTSPESVIINEAPCRWIASIIRVMVSGSDTSLIEIVVVAAAITLLPLSQPYVE